VLTEKHKKNAFLMDSSLLLWPDRTMMNTAVLNGAAIAIGSVDGIRRHGSNTTNRDDIEDIHVEPTPTRSSRMTMEEVDLLTLIEEPPDDHVPAFSFCSNWRFWWEFVKLPTLFVAVNVIAISSLLFPNDRSNSYGNYIMPDDKDGDSNDAIFATMRRNAIVWGVLFFCDTIVLFRAALSMEQQVTSMRRREQESASASSSSPRESEASWAWTNVHAKVSKRVDVFLNHQSHHPLPEVTLFVNGIFLLTGLSFVATIVCISMYGFLHTSKAASLCLRVDKRRHSAYSLISQDTRIPADLREWASAGDRGSSITGGGGRYIHMVDGTTYFQGLNDTARAQNKDEEQDRSNPILYSVGPGGHLQSYPQISIPQLFTNLVGASDEASQVFCCTFENETKLLFPQGKIRTVFIPSILCRGGGGGREGWTPSTSLVPELKTIGVVTEHDIVRQFRRQFCEGLSLLAHDGILFLRLQCYFRRSGVEQLEILTLNPQTMNLTSIAKTHVDDIDMYGHLDYGSPCSRWIQNLSVGVSVPLLLLTAYWLVKLRDIPAGMTPCCFGVFIVASWIALDWVIILGRLLSVGATIALLGHGRLPHWVSRDIVVWGLYTTLVVSAVASLEFWCCWRMPVVTLCLAAVIGVILNHPVLQIMGGVGAVVTLLLLVLAVFLTPGDGFGIFTHGYQSGRTFWNDVPLGLVISSGLFSLSFSIQKHRSYLVAYWRRAVRILQLASQNAFTRRGGGNSRFHPSHANRSSDTGLLQSLLSTRDE
jgi:hypothetical protein